MLSARRQTAKRQGKGTLISSNQKVILMRTAEVTNRVVGRTLFIHRLRGVKKEAIESSLKIIKTKLEKEDESHLSLLKSRRLGLKVREETKNNAQENETDHLGFSSSVVPASKHRPDNPADGNIRRTAPPR